jgi:hypothetical protein
MSCFNYFTLNGTSPYTSIFIVFKFHWGKKCWKKTNYSYEFLIYILCISLFNQTRNEDLRSTKSFLDDVNKHEHTILDDVNKHKHTILNDVNKHEHTILDDYNLSMFMFINIQDCMFMFINIIQDCMFMYININEVYWKWAIFLS